MAKQKKVRLNDIRVYDFAHEDEESCFVRLLEMTVDQITQNSAYIPQFWKDVELYGLDEATAYLKRELPDLNYKEYDALVDEIKRIVWDNIPNQVVFLPQPNGRHVAQLKGETLGTINAENPKKIIWEQAVETVTQADLNQIVAKMQALNDRHLLD
jgi:hypothetical protein